MIIKGTSRSGPAGLATHLGNAEENERVQVLESRGTIANDLRGALLEMDTYAIGTKCAKPLYHAVISPGQKLTPEQRLEAIQALEDKLGLTGHARIVVLHEKHGREHIHVVWSRINTENMRSVPDSHNYRKHEEVSRDLERRFGHERVQGAHHERDGVERPRRTPSRAELRQEERTGIRGKDVAADVTAAFRKSDGPEAFRSALLEAGYVLAPGDRRDFVVVDRAGGTHSLARRIDDVHAAQLREFMSPLGLSTLPTVLEAQRLQIGDARTPQELDEEQRARRAAYFDDKIEAAYARGDDFVSQSRAAQHDFERRQHALDKENNRDSLWERIEKGEAARENDEQTRREQEKTARNQEEVNARAEGPAPASDRPNIEITDRMARLLGAAEEKRERDRDEDLGDRHGEAPGRGRTRSRFE